MCTLFVLLPFTVDSLQDGSESFEGQASSQLLIFPAGHRVPSPTTTERLASCQPNRAKIVAETTLYRVSERNSKGRNSAGIIGNHFPLIHG